MVVVELVAWEKVVQVAVAKEMEAEGLVGQVAEVGEVVREKVALAEEAGEAVREEDEGKAWVAEDYWEEEAEVGRVD